MQPMLRLLFGHVQRESSRIKLGSLDATSFVETHVDHDGCERPISLDSDTEIREKKRLLDLLHIVHLGTLRDLIPAAILDSLEDGTLEHFFGTHGKPWNETLHAFSRLASAWAKDAGMQLYMGTLTMARLGRPKYRHWPMPALDTRIKAAKTRTLFAFTTFVMLQLANSPVLNGQPGKKKTRPSSCSVLLVFRCGAQCLERQC